MDVEASGSDGDHSAHPLGFHNLHFDAFTISARRLHGTAGEVAEPKKWITWDEFPSMGRDHALVCIYMWNPPLPERGTHSN